MLIHGPFVLHNSFTTPEDCVNAIVLMHESGGVEQVTMSAVARHLGMSRASVHQAHGNAAGFYVSLVDRFGYRWRDWLTDGRFDPTPIRLPEDELARWGVLTWASLRAIAAAEARAGRPEAWEIARRAVGRERGFVADDIRRAAGRPAETEEVDLLMAVAEGLRAQMTEPADALGFEDATAIATKVWTSDLGFALGPRYRAD